ncbi:CD109 antigen-like [Saccostrea cucullata]|uniref:CD109 antigen-like n=1 Tax=Saccostrea cuccullata TaxID=36930 RepID=UPI002ED1F10E
MQVRLLHTDRKPKVGSILAFEIRTTEITSNIYYQIISKGGIIESGGLDMQSSKLKRFNLTIIKEMTPRARLITHYVRKDGEIVADAISFNIDGSFENNIEIDFDVQETRPGNEVVVSIKADPDSTVHLLAVDKSVLILRNDNDIKESTVLEELKSYDQYCSYGSCFIRVPSLFGVEDTDELFQENNLAVLTDAMVYKTPRPPFEIVSVMRSDRRVSIGGSIAEPKKHVRTLFPETWFWLNKTIGPDGMTSLSVPVPDSITTWVATAFAVNPNSGLGLDPSPANLRVFQPFFVSLTLPYSVIRGELVVLQVNVFNYLKKDIKVLVIINKNTAFKNVITYLKDNQAKTGRFSFRIGRTFNIAPGEIYPVYFPIVPSEIGDLKINITATSTGASDSIIRTLKVEPEGLEKELNNPVLINTGDSGTFSEDVRIEFPPNTVAGSRRIRASVIGDVMGPSINGLDSLLKMPYGCGEQNMLNFAPNIFVQKYLKVTNNLTPDLEKKAKEYMIKGYQRQMTYVHPDGSYSAFGKSDASGSTW